ncbi:MAG: tetratricopeptide repeat protein [Candidatus Eisenbacteria bacterium]|nr:tetratricopeptide repeat protein [Candidatus Eisenbacteria bacterium]
MKRADPTRAERRSNRPGSLGLPSVVWLVVAIAASFLLHARAINHPWISDDHVILKDNPTLRRTEASTPLRLIGLDYWSALDAEGRAFPLVGDRNLYRPATTISYWINARLTGITPAGLRSGNVLLHGLAAGILGLLCAALFGGPAGLLAGAAVLAHPVGTDVINRIVGRADILVLVGIAGFLLVARPIPGRGWSPFRVAAAALLALTALGAKETGLALLPIAALQAWLSRPPGAPWDRVRWIGPAIALSAGILVLGARTAFVGWPRYDPVPGLDLLMNPLSGMGWLERLPAALSLGSWYVQLLVAPWPLLTLDRPARLPDWGSPTVWIGAVVLAGMLLLLIRSVRRRHFWGLAAVWWLAMFALVGQILAPIGTYREVRIVYPFLGSLALGLAGAFALVRPPWRGPARAAAAIGVGLLMVLTIIRTDNYGSEVALYEADVRHHPDSPLTHLMLGVVYSEANRAGDARRARETALSLAPDSPQALNEVAALEVQAGNFPRAEELLSKALTLEPRHSVALMNLGNLRAQQDRLEEAHALLLRSERLNPAYSLIQVNLALVEALLGRPADALRRADLLGRQNPNDPNVAAIRRLAGGAR